MFVRHRKQANDKNFTAEAAELNLKKCVKLGSVDAAVAAVLYSVERGWRGVFPAKTEKERGDGPAANSRYGRNADERRHDRAAANEFAQADEGLPIVVAGGGRPSSPDVGGKGEIE